MRSTWPWLLAALPQLAGAAAMTGDGVDCARLLQPDQRVQVITGGPKTRVQRFCSTTGGWCRWPWPARHRPIRALR